MRPPRGPETPTDQLEVIRRGAAEIITEPDLQKKLSKTPKLTIKAGFDPTAPDLHLGHTVLLRKLRQFQDLGHKVVFLIGDATGLVGDPSGVSQTRPVLTPAAVKNNAQTYVKQVSKILKTGERRVFELRYNSEWFLPAGPKARGTDGAGFDFFRLAKLLENYTVARVIERDDFRKRLSAGQEISMLELFYPLMQGYDSVMLKADVELGGTDQKFNLLVGRDLQRSYGQEPQVVLTMPLLEGTDGTQKMSKSLGNHIGITEPPTEMFGKLMSIPDTLIVKYLTLLTDTELSRVSALERQLGEKSINPRDAKAELAAEIVTIYHGAAAAQRAGEEFTKVFSKRQLPSEFPTRVLKADAEGRVNFIELMVDEGLAPTKNEARRLLKQRAVKLNNSPLSAPELPIADSAGVLQVGPRHFRKLVAPRRG